MVNARARCWVHEDCLVDLELSVACGPNPPDMQVLDAGWADSGEGGYGDGWGGFSADGDGWASGGDGGGYGDFGYGYGWDFGGGGSDFGDRFGGGGVVEGHQP